MPGANTRALEKARTLPADALIIVPEEATSLAAGDVVQMLSLDGTR